MTVSVRELTHAVVAERARPVYRLCPWCGRPCVGPACSGHRDLTLIEQQLYSENNAPSRTSSTGARPGASTTGG